LLLQSVKDSKKTSRLVERKINPKTGLNFTFKKFVLWYNINILKLWLKTCTLNTLKMENMKSIIERIRKN